MYRIKKIKEKEKRLHREQVNLQLEEHLTPPPYGSWRNSMELLPHALTLGRNLDIFTKNCIKHECAFIDRNTPDVERN